MIQISNLCKKFGKKEVLHDIDLKLDTGVYGLLGPNGAGKTTLIRCIVNLYSWNGGEILISGKPLKNNKAIMNQIGYLPQQFGTYKDLSVYDALILFCSLKDIPKPRMDEEIDRVLDEVNLTDRKLDKVKHLSGGMVRRLGIAQAILDNPAIVLLDEPTSGLDPEERLRVKRIISNLGKNSVVLLSTHIVEDVEAICDKIIIMDQGSILKEGTQTAILKEAEGKVYFCDNENLESIPIERKVFIEKEQSCSGKVCYRVLSSESLPFQAVSPTVEDGVLCILKGI